MENSPNTNDAPAGVSESTVICPACGASVAASAHFCGACGAEIVAQPAKAQPAKAQAATGAEAAQAATEPIEGGKLCNWCRSYSPADATTCVTCGAHFPTPEGDEAIERAAKERISDMQQDIAKTRSLMWWPFRGR